jgi:hypothetical protein
MPTVNVAAIVDNIQKKFDDEITRHINRSTPVFQVMGVKRANGPVIQWVNTFNTSPPTAPIAEGATVSSFNTDTKVPATLDYTTYHDAFEITGLALAKAAAAGNPAALADLFREELAELIPRLALNIASDVYVGTGSSNEMIGLVATNGGIRATGTYAGINRGTYSQWGATEMANGGILRPLEMRLLRRARRYAKEACGFAPDFYITSTALFEAYEALLGDKRRYLEEVTVKGRKVVLDGGMRALSFDGTPVIEDISCPTNDWLGGQASMLDIFQLPSPADAVNRSTGSVALHGTAEHQFGETQTGLTARILPLPAQGDKYPFAVFVYPSVRVKKPNAFIRITDLEPPV